MELYFKSMLPPKTWGHELKILFENLNDDIKNEIKKIVSTDLKKLACYKSFEEYLEYISKAFAECVTLAKKLYYWKFRKQNKRLLASI